VSSTVVIFRIMTGIVDEVPDPLEGHLVVNRHFYSTDLIEGSNGADAWIICIASSDQLLI
jgi:hypothetical protein